MFVRQHLLYRVIWVDALYNRKLHFSTGQRFLLALTNAVSLGLIEMMTCCGKCCPLLDHYYGMPCQVLSITGPLLWNALPSVVHYWTITMECLAKCCPLLDHYYGMPCQVLSITGPLLWNALPSAIWNANALPSSKAGLKTVFFCEAFCNLL